MPYIRTGRAQAAVGGVPPGEALGKQEILRSLVLLVRLICESIRYMDADKKNIRLGFHI